MRARSPAGKGRITARLPESPDFPQLAVAGDPQKMREVFEAHLLAPSGAAGGIRSCQLSRIRYRRDERCVLQYTLRVAEPTTGTERDLRVTGFVYAREGRAEKTWRKLRATAPEREIPGSSAFEPVSFIPELAMLVQVFPFDRRLPSLPLLTAGPSGSLERPLLDRLGPGDWRAESWTVEPVRYRDQLGAVLRYEVRARDKATGAKETRRFYVKVYRDEQGEQTHRTLETLGGVAADGNPFAVVKPVVYLKDLRALVLEEAPGTAFEQLLLRGRGTSARVVARALAAFNRSEPPTGRRHRLADQVSQLQRSAGMIEWCSPHLSPAADGIVEAVATRLEDVPPSPTHRDLKTDHLFLDGERVVFVDLDSFAGADPVLDPAYLLARLAAMPHLLPLPWRRARAAARAFEAEYFARVPEVWRGKLPVHYAGALLEISTGLFRRQEPGWPAKIAALLEEAEASLAGRVW